MLIKYVPSGSTGGNECSGTKNSRISLSLNENF